jgi:hypothetical protein
MKQPPHWQQQQQQQLCAAGTSAIVLIKPLLHLHSTTNPQHHA